MKVIDLLNKIANGEEIPKKIAIQNDVLIYKEKHVLYLQDYYLSDEENATWKIWAYKLNDEVEILEEEKKIPEKEDELIRYNIQEFDDLKEFVEITTNDLFGKVNKIINKLNGVIDYLKSKGE